MLWQRGWVAGWLSVARRYCIKTAKSILKLLPPPGSPIILVSSDLLRRYPITQFQLGVNIHGGRKNWRLSTEIAVYLGGVAIYVRSTLQSNIWTYAADNSTYELLWVQVNSVIAGALYHPPRPLYDSSSLIDYIEGCTDEITRTFPQKLILLAGDFNQLSIY